MLKVKLQNEARLMDIKEAEETVENSDRHHSWAQATAENAVSAAILEWRLIVI